ncbi:CAP domain-containing protein [Egicoccus sp. AB-alg2]|uniref:CAP domain-containing protein n=1 Tax=Egicoccus sp. AB-alg2 TaxID=3242693 RepID=UPI00359E404F
MAEQDDWAVRIERLRPQHAEVPRTGSGRGGRQPRRRPRWRLPRGWRAVVPVVVVLGLWFVAESIPAPVVDPPDPVTLAAESRRLGWTGPAENQALAEDVFERVNDERIARGLRPLLWHPDLAERAGTWSLRMIEDTYEHSPDGFLAHPRFPGTGENIAMGQRDTMEVHVDWMESAGHRENILRPGFTAMGVGIVCRNDGRMWATQVFGMPAGPAPAGAAPTVDTGPPPVEPVTRRDDGVACPRPARLLPLQDTPNR